MESRTGLTSNVSYLRLAATRNLTLAANDETKALLECLECPVCLEITLPPIYNCETGHVICNLCKSHLIECPLCACPYTTSRNFPLESLVRSAKFHCQNLKGGCTMTENIDELQKHLENCTFKPISCHLNGFDGCKGASLYASEYEIHLKNMHSLSVGDSAEGKLHVFRRNFTFSDWDKVEDKNRTWTSPLMSYNGSVFLSHVFSRGGMFYFGVSLLGMKPETVRYSAKITIQQIPLVPKYEVTILVPSILEFSDNLPFAVIHKDFLERLGHLCQVADTFKRKFNWCVRYEMTALP